MSSLRRYIVLVWFVCVCAFAYTQTDTIRYVHPNGAYTNDGRSWANAKNRVQDAINDLHEYLVTNSLTSGSVYIAAGTYTPTESTESTGGSMLNTSFKIYAGIHVYGGFNPDTPESKPGDRIMVNGKKVSENWADQSGLGTTSGDEIASQWDLRHKTILTGNHAGSVVSFTFDSIRGRYNTVYPASSYHVVWFATNGKYTTSDNTLKDHFKPLEHPASLDGCVISSGNASTRNTNIRDHTAYGGGVYMVGNSSMRACIIERCSATMRGGGIYMDGGGIAEFCNVHTCQSIGVGVVEGYGGGVCIDQEGSIGHSHITSCAARCGGGVLIYHDNSDYPWAARVAEAVLGAADTITSYYSPYATACVINNNTANAEGGGIYLAEGGTVNHCTVTANNCSGLDVTYYGRRHGRSGGIYVRNCGQIFNSVFWGNRCDANNDIQFASVRQKTGVAEFETFVYHTAFMNHDITDWTGVRKECVYTLEKQNLPVQDASGNFPIFFRPTVVPLNWDTVNTTVGIYGAGVLAHMRPVDYPGPRIWHLTAHSSLDQKGVQYSPAMVNPPLWLVHAHTDYGVVSNPYEPASTLGALVRQPDEMRHSLQPQQGLEGRKDDTPIPTVFVDLSHAGDYDEEGHFIIPPYTGNTWDDPLHSIGDALLYYRTYLVEEPDNAIGERAHYHLPSAWDEDGNPSEYEDYDYVQILVKEGEQSTAGPNNYLGKDMRTASIRTLSHMRMYGGYPDSLSGTNTEGRDPLNLPTIITANIANEKGEVAYQNNSAHVLTYVNAEYTIVDGFQLLNGNAHNLSGTRAVMAGGGVLVSNEIITDRNKRIDMVGNELRNCRLANNSAPKGAAIYVTGDSRNKINDLCYAELKVVNCIIRNNTADYSSGNHGIITANGRAFIDMDHCDIVNNVGYPFKSDNRMWKYSYIVLPIHGHIRVDNSLVYCNGTEVMNDRSSLTSANVLSVDEGGQDYVFGTYNMFDADIQLHTEDATQPHGFFKDDFVVPTTPGGVLPTGMPDAANHPLKLVMPAEKNNQCILTRTDRNVTTYPVFINPSRNIGHSVEGDRPLFGGKVSFIPLNNNPCVNAASLSAYGGNNIPRPDEEDFDLTDFTRRNYGGEPDIGALEDTDLPVDGTVIYVTPDGAGKRDGSSWANAIAGNTVYVLNDITGPALADGDQIDPEATCNRVLDSEGNPILTTNEKYNGGWGKVWFTNKQTGGSTTTTVTKTWTTEKNVYDNGPKEGDEDLIQDNVYSESSNTVSTPGSTPGGFIAGYDYDPRYPYGEISGASRTFWRANPYSGTSGSYNINTFIAGCKANGWINNTRAERYVGGLQYAVEKASAANKTYHADSVQVWVGAGTYNDYKGFIMRDSVTVLGGFPATKYKSPGMSERQALMSDVVTIPKAKSAEKLSATDYETILQISEVNPKSSNTAINPAAIKYSDDDYSYSEQTETTQYEYKSRTIVHHYESSAEDRDGDEVTSSFIQYANMANGSAMVVKTTDTTYSADNDTVYRTFGTATSTMDCWHISYPNKTNYLVIEETNNNADGSKGKDIYDPNFPRGTKIITASQKWLFLGNGSMSGLTLWQTMRNVPEGKYKITFDLGGEYKNYPANDDPLNIFVCVVDGSGIGISDTISLKSRTNNKNNNRGSAFRFTLNFEQPATGDAVFKLFIGEGNKNTKGRDATYGTVTGIDPDPIPCKYVGNNGTCEDPDKWGTKNPNAREFWLSNIHVVTIIPAGTYEFVGTDDETEDKGDVPHEAPVISETKTYTVQTHRTTLRKRVLTMPDVCVPTFGGGGIGDPVNMTVTFGDNLAHTDRVWGATKAQRTATTQTKQEDLHYVEYNEASWDGFTIRHGFLYDESMSHGGGSGVNMYEGGHLRNCIVTNNFSGSRNMKGGGMFCDGATSTIEGCFVLNNTSTHGTAKNAQNQIFAGGMFMYEGTCFNSLFANNYSYGSAGGLGFCVGRFFNNTIAYNTATLVESKISGGAISLATSSNPNLFVANTVIFGNNGIAIRDRNTNYENVNPFLYCYIQSAVEQPYDATKKNVNNWTEAVTTNYGTGNTFLNGVAPSAANTPFAADFDENGNYVAGRAASLNDFRLRDDVPCVNKGTEEFAGEFYTALIHKGKSDSEIRNLFIYKSVEASQLPDNDVAFAKRVQDCQIDMGAYEFNAAYSIKPDTTTHPGQAIFYVSFDAHGGDASSSSPENAACKQKLQLVIDAAGRYKYYLMHRTYGDLPATPVAGEPDSTWTVEVWMEGDNTNSTVSGEYDDWYTATRSTKHNMENYVDNTLDYSFIIPHGVHIKGGYTSDFTGRDPLTYRTVLSGRITSSTGAEGNVFHVVTFTEDLFTPDETFYLDGNDDPIQNQLASMTSERHRAVLDGLFIMEGHANSPDLEDRIGAGAVVTGYAHIRNCVIQNNTAEAYGGGLYLKPHALVSGTIIKNNTAETGGGIYIEAPASLSLDSLAHVFSSTICENTARATAGGMYFDNTYARVNSTALWHNEANDYANISGIFSRSSDETDYPLNFCAVESRRLEGQGNVELSPKETEGVRWDRQDPFNAILYYPIEMSSTLSRAGMTYTEWYRSMTNFTTLDSVDIAGVSRTKWNSDGSKRGYAWTTDTLVTKNNDFIEIGARAINKNFAINVDMRYVMNRLYVMHTDLINSEAARALQDNPDDDDNANMYRQMGSCILNPFHRLGDAFDYIIEARKSNPALYRNRVFSVFIEQGTYYPYHNAYGEQDEVRNNTFLVPEGIYVIGGIDSRPEDHHYGQEGYYDMFTGASYGDVNTNVEVAGYTIYSASLDSIRLRDARHRPMRDNNLNSVIEPWELERQTILSGNAVAGEDFTHVYHVITMHADSTHVGPQPLKFRSMNPARLAGDKYAPMLVDPIPIDRPDLFDKELDQSILGRTTEFDGIQITGGYANHLMPEDTLSHPYVKKTYFRGGGIFVDGNWDSDFDEPGEVLPNVTEPAVYNIPIVVENCLFTNNMAGNGGGLYSNGGIYMYGCHFVQNYSQGPMTELDQNFIPWTAGGCIATNAVCDVSNSLFDNNEARRGLYPITVSGDEEIPYADARQGFGGCLSVAAQSRMRVINCHFMKNKAVAYPSIYNFYSNSRYSDPDSMQFAFNTIFWGNEVFEVESLAELDNVVPPSEQTINDFNTRYKSSRKGVFHYDGEEWTKYENLYQEYNDLYNSYAAAGDTFNVAVTDKLAELRAQGDKLEGLYFCSYRKTYGPTGMKPTSDGYLLTEAEQRAFVDPRKKPVRLKMVLDYPVERYDNLFTYVHGNNNTLINPINTATDGPNFKQPSFIAGIDGYMQNADWLLARMNLTTDQGWGHLKQTVTRGIGYYLTRYTGKIHYPTAEAALKAANDTLNTDTCTMWSVLPVSGLPVANFDDVQSSPGAIYNWYSTRFGTYMSDACPPLPIKDQYYMAYTRSSNDEDASGNMERISRQPKSGVTDVYIDVGVYEYQYVQLDITGQEIDTMWVATKTKDPIKNDGLTWETPTTDLQTAIDILMSSHNNHDKYICFLGDDEGTFSPSNVIDNRRAFIITSNTLEPLMPDSAQADFDYGVNSLTFLGGYSYDVKDAPRDPYAHPTVIEMPNVGTAAQRNQLFIVEDMTRQMAQVNWQGEYISRDSVVIPIVFDGITFINPYSVKEPSDGEYSSLGGSMSKKGGAAIYYRWQRRYENDGTSTGSYTPNFNYALHPDSALIDGRKITLPKLTISNCIFMDNGMRTENHAERSPAVRIAHGGGSSLIVNTLFHSNAGAPVYARTYDIVEEENNLASVPNDVILINVTSALNDGHIRLESENSEVHNSLIWLDDLHNDTTIQLQLGASDQWDKNTNKDRQGIGGRMTHNAVWGCFQPFEAVEKGDSCYNHPLATDNNDIFRGPGFFSPYVTATTSEQRRERSFRLNPTVRTQNMADTTIYWDHVFFRQYPELDEGEPYWLRSNGFKDLTVTSVANDVDLAAKPRLSGKGMERGAYECLAVLQRVLYVRPELPAYSAGDGSSWEKAFGQGQIQNAIDAAAVYTYMNQSLPREDRKAYVFVKGSGSMTDHYNLVARDGVYVYGSLPNYFNDTAWIDEEQKKFTNEECHRFVNYVRATTPGVASPNAPQTKINSIHITGDEFQTGFLLDGFVITNSNVHHPVEPVILDNAKSAIRNCLIIDNAIHDLPVADVRNGLLYNCLFYNDTAATVVKVGANGLVLNNTIIAETDGVTPLDVSGAAVGAVQNNIALNSQLAPLSCFAPYMKGGTPYELPAYLTSHKPLYFQFHEYSAQINAGTMDTGLPALYDDYKTDGIINFKWDRDILGNPRKISSSVDMGALETWRVPKNQAQEITAITNRVVYTSISDMERDTAYTKNYGGHLYPHQGSVVYLMDSAVMSMQYEDEENTDFVDLQNQPIIFSPGFMLLKPGASFYGNKYNVQMNYLAAEKRFVNQRYSMTAFPYNYNTANITVSKYVPAKDSLHILLSPFRFDTYLYAGAARSAKDYVFQPSNSTSWLAVDTLNRTATEGYLMDFGATRDTVLRFTAFAPVAGQYVYTEDGDDKSVYLTQYDNRTAGTGTDLNFTRQEDMGWNMKGLPWLVSNYRTDTILAEGNYLRQMFIPHVFYQMDGAGEYLTAGDQMYTARSWDNGVTMSMGSAFFTQTATTASRETVVFHLPYYGFNKKAARPILLLAARRYDRPAVQSSDYLTVIADSTANKNVTYTYGRDGIKWLTNDSVAQVYMLDSKRQSRISFLDAAPTEYDIPLGVYVPENKSQEYTFVLPEKEAFADYGYVWLIDYQNNHYTNLLDGDYETHIPSGQYNNRFALRIGGYPRTGADGKRQYIVYAYNSTLFVRGLVAGDVIDVITASGQKMFSTIASAPEFSMPLSDQTGFIVMVNNVPHKVLNW